MDIKNLIDDFSKKKVLVIGDSILDKSVFGSALGLSLESPTLKGKKEKTEISFGGAGNAIENILELGAKCTFITLLGEDPDSELYKNFKCENLEFIPIIEQGRLATVKERHWMTRCQTYKVLQWDQLDNREIKETSIKKALELLKNSIKNYDIILLIDYRHGMMSKSFIDSIKKIAKDNNIFTIASSQVSESSSNHLDYSGVDLIVMNQKEACFIDKNFSIENTDTVENLSKILNSNVCVTLGDKGSILFYKNNKYLVEAIKVTEVDSCGAGDSFISALALGDLKNNPKDSLKLANIFAGLSVKEIGAKPPKKSELLKYLKYISQLNDI
jgi:rfaE bifunctional protein kinase chain/domain